MSDKNETKSESKFTEHLSGLEKELDRYKKRAEELENQERSLSEQNRQAEERAKVAENKAQLAEKNLETANNLKDEAYTEIIKELFEPPTKKAIKKSTVVSVIISVALVFFSVVCSMWISAYFDKKTSDNLNTILRQTQDNLKSIKNSTQEYKDTFTKELKGSLGEMRKDFNTSTEKMLEKLSEKNKKSIEDILVQLEINKETIEGIDRKIVDFDKVFNTYKDDIFDKLKKNEKLIVNTGLSLQSVILSKQREYELVRIPGGVFMMGSPENERQRPLHAVRVPDFYMGKYPVTNKEYGVFLKERPDIPKPKYWKEDDLKLRPYHPVVGVRWENAKRYADWAGLVLPSEAQWEYACRAGTNTRYYTGDTEDDLGRAGWYYGNAEGRTHSVGQKEPNKFGLYDMHGNVWEWVEDDWHDDYNGAPNDGSSWIDNNKHSGTLRVIRGGSLDYFPSYCRSAFRFSGTPGDRDGNLGFRLARPITLDP